MRHIGIIFLVFGIYGTFASVERSLCSIPDNDPHMKYYIMDRNTLKVVCEDTYSLMGTEQITCVNTRWIEEKPLCVKDGCRRNALIETKNGIIHWHPYKARRECFPGYTLSGNYATYCNGTHWDRPLGICQLKTEKTEYECDFETEDLCGWTTKTVDYQQWTRNIAVSEYGSFHAGPPHDHTIMSANAGYYMVLRSRERDGIDAPLFSPYYSSIVSSEKASFSFFYYMFGEGVGSLSVYIKPKSVAWETLLGHAKYLRFNISGPQGETWKQGVFDVSEIEEDFQIVFVARSSSRPLSDIAIDDVKLSFSTDMPDIPDMPDMPVMPDMPEINSI